MKKIGTLLLLTLLLITSCGEDADPLLPSQLDTSTPDLSELDKYIREEFVKPYNIRVQYVFDENEVAQERFLNPPRLESVKPALNILLTAWIAPYSEVAGEDFIKKIAPREFTLIGSFNTNPSGTITLGLAEAGAKITLFNIDYLDFTDLNSINQPLRTVQHEYGHILNQTRPIDPSYREINPGNYTAQWFNRSDAEARELGYITAYASSNSDEDFVEMIAEMLTNTREEFDALVNSINNLQARAIIRLKETYIADYYQKSFGIDIYELQEVAHEKSQSLVN